MRAETSENEDSTDCEEDNKQRKVKRYKTALFKNYESNYRYIIGEVTRSRWDFLCNQLITSGKSYNYKIFSFVDYVLFFNGYLVFPHTINPFKIPYLY